MSNEIRVKLSDYVYVQVGLAAHRAGKSIGAFLAEKIAERCNAPTGGTTATPAKKGAIKVQCTGRKAVK